MNDRLTSICPNLNIFNNRIAIIEKDKIVTYGELATSVDRLAHNIMKMALPKCSRIGLSFENTNKFVCSYMAILAANCIPVLFSTGVPSEKAAYILEDSGAIGMISDIRTFLRIKSFPHQMRFAILDGAYDNKSHGPVSVHSFENYTRSEDIVIETRNYGNGKLGLVFPQFQEIASIIYTSGTTGKPKGVMLSEKNLLIATSAITEHLRVVPTDVCLVTMSFAHCAGMLHMLAHLRVGAKIVTGENPALIGPFLDAIRKNKVTILAGVPSFFILLTRHPKHKVAPYLHSIRAVESSSSMINERLIEEIFELFSSAAVFNTYGLTEAPRATYIELDRLNPDRNLSLGHPTSNVDIHVVNEKGEICFQGEEGEIIIKGPNVSMGYWNNLEKTNAVFTSNSFKTGDIGSIDEKGFLFIKGRRDDMVKIGAEVVYPFEIEGVIAKLPGIAEVLAYGVKDETGEFKIHVKAVCNENEISEQDIRNICREKLEKHKVPSRVIFCEKIVVEESGKPLRRRF
jgi:acyl-CoA synthetase (AMP-forming)/AMP-acid ligase II